ncbi:MAG: trypsin-like serine protease [Chloroflexi bacterium]|nr:trypsin-like serine protease [Chloroflexota bacterium]
MRKLMVVLAALALVLTLSIPAYAINYGEPDGDDHPYVGVMVAYDETGAPLWRCSGSVITPTVFLTAGHCVYGAASAQVWFESTRDELVAAGYPLAGGTTGTPIPHPEYDDFASYPITHDVGVVILDEPVTVARYAELPEENFLDGLATRRGLQDVTFTTVGYGVQSVKPRAESVVTRYQATSSLINLRSHLTDGHNLMTTNNPGNGRGGNCSGDSGGPILYSDSDLVVAVNSFGVAPNCKGNDYAYRVDIEDTREFLAAYVTLP